MSFESSLLTQISVENPLPTMVEMEISRSLNTSMKRAFVFFYLLAAEKLSALAPLLPYADEIYLALNVLFERFLIFHADTTFTELMFGLRRAQITGPKSAVWSSGLSPLQLLTGAGGWNGLRWLLLGPAPVRSEEQRAVDFAASQGMRYMTENTAAITTATAVVGAGEGVDGSAAAANISASAEPLQLDQLTHGLGDATAASTAITATPNGGVDEVAGIPVSDYNASELMSASRASYGYLRFSPMSRSQRIISLFLLTIKPYVEKRVKILYVNETDASPDAVSLRAAYAHRYPARAQLKRTFSVFVFPLLHVCQKTAELVFKVLYLCECTPYPSPLHRLFNIAVKRGSLEENTSVSPKAQRALTLARILIFVVFFSFQIFEFTRSTGFSGASLMDDNDESSLPIPPPPVWGVDVQLANAKRNGGSRNRSAVYDATRRRQLQVQGAGAGDQEAAEYSETETQEEEPLAGVQPGKCPVCKKAITNAAVLATSGVLGCYPCLQQVVSEKHACPVTGKPTTVAHIRRVFEC